MTIPCGSDVDVVSLSCLSVPSDSANDAAGDCCSETERILAPRPTAWLEGDPVLPLVKSALPCLFVREKLNSKQNVAKLLFGKKVYFDFKPSMVTRDVQEMANFC